MRPRSIGNGPAQIVLLLNPGSLGRVLKQNQWQHALKPYIEEWLLRLEIACATSMHAGCSQRPGQAKSSQATQLLTYLMPTGMQTYTQCDGTHSMIAASN